MGPQRAVGRREQEADRTLCVLRRIYTWCIAAYVASLLAEATGLWTETTLRTAVQYCLLMAVVIGATAFRAALYAADRPAWLCFAAGLTCCLTGYVIYALLQGRDLGVARPSVADAAWLALYPFLYAALVLMLRSRVRRLSASTWLDGLVVALTVAAVAVAAAVGDAARALHGPVPVFLTSVSYPVADTVLLVLVAGALTVIGRGAGSTWWWLATGIALYAVSDVVYALRTAQGTYVGGSILDVGWGAAVVCFGVAALRSPRTTLAGPATDRVGLVIPGVCALAALGLLFRGYLLPGDPVAGVLALSAVLAALARMTLTFREVRALADSRRQARTDELTGLPNRRRVYEALADADVRLAAGTGTAVLVIDLDRFKEVNDSLGHVAGDALLRQVGPRLHRHLSANDLLARLGGDEFVVLADDVTRAEALLLAERLHTELQQPFSFGALQLTVGASIGLAVGPEHAATAEELLQLADLAMYSAKAARTGTAVFDDDRDGEGRHRLETVEQLRSGISEGQLVLHYQPKVHLHTGWVTGVETLVRWAHPTRGLLMPGGFVELAESSGLMPRLTAAVLDAALAQCRAWLDAGTPLAVSVNVSPSDLVDDGFADQVADRLAAHGLSPSLLVLEVTESVLMTDRAVDMLHQLRATGVGISIDDYGTGYSSLARLAALPVTELKLDRAFTTSLAGNARAAAVVTSTLQLARALGLVLVAEGAEDQATVDALARLDCDLVQGYHVGRPLPADQLTTWLGARQGVLAVAR